jgi:hypothetical protein
MSRPHGNHRILAGVAVVVVLSLSAQFQRFLQSYKDESVATGQTSPADTSQSGLRKEYVGDFQVYYTSSMVVRHSADHRLYYPQPGGQIFMDNLPADTNWGRAARAAGFPSTMPFNYPPFAALLLQPLCLLKWQSALLIWRVVLVGVVLCSIYLCVRLTGSDYFWLKFGFAAVAALSFFPLTETLVEGQIDPFILLFWIAGIYLFESGHTLGSAFLFALGTVVKVSPAIAVALFLLRRQWAWLLSYVSSLIVLVLLSIWRLGWSNHILFVKEVLPKLSCGMALLANRSLPGLIYDIYLRRVPLAMEPSVPAGICTVAKMIGVALLIACMYLLWRRNKTQNIPTSEFMAFALLSLLVSPVSWRHHYLLALLPLIYVWNSESIRRFDLAVLTVATLSIGSVLPDYVITAVHKPALQLLLVSATPMSTLLLLFVICSNHFASLEDEAGVCAASSSRSF